MNFAALSRSSLLGRVARAPLKLIPPSAILPILQGPLAGKRWIVGSSTHGCWVGSYEWEKQRLFHELSKQARVVYDVGAHVGFYTLLAADTVGRDGVVAAFEPWPANVEYLRRHVALNDFQNVRVFPHAVGLEHGRVTFASGAHSSMSHIAHEGEHGVGVDVVSLDELTGANTLPLPDVMKIDVEGSEVAVLNGAAKTIAAAHPTVLLATHGPTLHEQCCEWLVARGYAIDQISDDELVARYRR